MILRPVDAGLVAATDDAVTSVADLVAGLVAGAAVMALGSSSHEGSLTKGDIDVLVRVPATGFDALVSDLESRLSPAQSENWTATFASFSTSDDVGVQLVPIDSDLDRQLLDQRDALSDVALRQRYDAAKLHGAPLGPDGYWQVKDLFWSSRLLTGPRWSQARRPILKVVTSTQWRDLLGAGETDGAPVDVADGFVHFSTPEQVGETVARHFAGQEGLWLLTLDADALGEALRWEPSRGGALFPHLYGPLRLADVCLARPWDDTTP